MLGVCAVHYTDGVILRGWGVLLWRVGEVEVLTSELHLAPLFMVRGREVGLVTKLHWVDIEPMEQRKSEGTIL